MISQNTLSVGAFALLAACSNSTQRADVVQDNVATAVTAPQSISSSTDNVPKAEIDAPALVVEAEGLRLFDRKSGSARPIAFGAPAEDVLKILAFQGNPKTGKIRECGTGALDFANWSNGLGLYFQNDKFVGWNLNARNEPKITTASGIGLGSSRLNLEAAYAAVISQTTLGTKFAVGELFGLLNGAGPTAQITNMWGGVSCNFR